MKYLLIGIAAFIAAAAAKALLAGAHHSLDQKIASTMQHLQSTRQKEAKIQERELSLALNMYHTDCRGYPSTAQNLKALVNKPATAPLCPHWGPQRYIGQLISDPWGRPFLYSSSGTGYVIWSYGADGKEGGTGENMDVVLRSH